MAGIQVPAMKIRLRTPLLQLQTVLSLKIKIRNKKRHTDELQFWREKNRKSKFSILLLVQRNKLLLEEPTLTGSFR